MKETNASLFLFSFFLFVFVGCGSSDSGGSRGSQPLPPLPVPPVPSVPNAPNIEASDLLPLSSFNAESYELSGTCDSSLSEKVIVMMSHPDREVELDCQQDNTFSGTIDARNVLSSPVLVAVSHGDLFLNVALEVENHIIRRLTLDSLETLSSLNVESYIVSGSCGSLLGSNVHVSLSDSQGNSVDGDTTCDPSSDTFSLELDDGGCDGGCGRLFCELECEPRGAFG